MTAKLGDRRSDVADDVHDASVASVPSADIGRT